MENNNSTLTPTEEFFKHCDSLDVREYVRIDGYDYIEVIDKGDGVILVISDAPMYGDGTYISTDVNSKDITVDDALKNLKLKYKDKNIKIIYLQK